ncbi:RNA polymerase beta subunit (plastid) [Lotharella oceanica]|uniref:DNA-directed RNA polymerase subunit beta n=1 Tax=Lotharella oceanica TaxID=641309 RepID=A0A059SL65_9EUKA|nr:RNA polymerase beta subunit [Lotharella oceanica]
MYITPLFLPNLLRIQRNSFFNFLEYGIKKEIQKLGIIVNKKKGIKIIFYPKLYQLSLPNFNCNDCIINSETYSCELSLPIKFIGKKMTVIWIVLNNIPIMTNNCHFILNGSPRIIMSQITRCPGIYYHKKQEFLKKDAYYADIIAERGTWLRLEVDLKNKVYLKMKKVPKVPFITFLQALGFKVHTIFHFLPFLILKNEEEEEEEDPILNSQNEAIQAIEACCRNSSKRNIGMNWNLLNIFDQLMNNKYYDLGKIGRIQINKKFQVYTDCMDFTLNSNDLLLAANFLLKLKHGLFEIDEVDNLKNKRVRIVGELLQYQLIIGILRLKKYIKNRLINFKDDLNITNVFSSTPINNTMAEFFGLNPLSQFMDEINPLSVITHKRRLSSLGFGGVSRDTATLTIRSIHPTLYGRICPIETPEGKNAGLVNSFSIFADVEDGELIRTPLLKMKNGYILYNTGINYLSADYDDNNSILSFDVEKSRIGFLSNKKLPTRIKQELKEIDSKNIDFISISRIQMLSIATSLIPFLEHNDANRVLMGSNMQRQAVPLLKPQCCLVGTGLESRIINDLDEGLTSHSDGIIYYLSSHKITIYNFIKKYKHILFKNSFFNDKKYVKIDIFSLLKNEVNSFNKILYDSSNIFLKNKKIMKIRDSDNLLKLQKIHYLMNPYKYSNQGTCNLNRTQVHLGQRILKRTALSTGLSTSHNELALGNNMFVGYISWKGYNFEDAVVISNRLVRTNLYTSTHLEKFEIEMKMNQENTEVLTRNVNGITSEQKRKLGRNGVIKVGSSVYSDDILVGRVLFIKIDVLSPYRKLLNEILQKESIRYDYKDISLRVPKYKQGRITFVNFSKDIALNKNQSNLNSKTTSNTTLLIHLMQNRIIQIGDKISGRHGNKGVISRVLNEIDMPYLIDGTVIDIILNPLGVPSRMNIGQVLECLLGLASNYLLKRFKVVPFDEAIDFGLSRNFVYSKLYLSKIKTGNSWLFNLSYSGKNRLIDSYSGLYFDQPVTIGKAYILKLIHLVEEKIHARSTGSYSLVTQQPLKGKSKNGGQRVGEMEVWAVEGYGAAYTLHEILTIKSDDIKNRQKIVSFLLESRPIKFGTTETFKVLIRELQSLCLNLHFFK